MAAHQRVLVCGLAEEETRLVGEGSGARKQWACDASFAYCRVCESNRFIVWKTPDRLPPADRLRAVLPVGTNRAHNLG